MTTAFIWQFQTGMKKSVRNWEKIVEDGVSSFKLYMTYDDMILDDQAIYQVLKRLKELGGIAGVHCEKRHHQSTGGRTEEKGNDSPSAHAVTRPAAVEAEAVSRLLKIAVIADTPVIVVHLSSSAGYQEVTYAERTGTGSLSGNLSAVSSSG